MNEESKSPAPVPKDSEEFGKIRNDAEHFGTIPNASETFRTIGKRSEAHTLTVREAARMFEGAGVARTERSIVNWCQPNRTGIARLDCYFDPNERKYFLTPQSVERAIKEEQAKAVRETLIPSEAVPNDSERAKSSGDTERNADPDEVKALRQEITDLRITNRGKDYFIEQLQRERQANIEQLMSYSRKVGELETKLLQLSGPDERQ
jgi:hypothetical protein